MRKEDSFSGFLLTSDSCCYVVLTPFLWNRVQRSKSPGHLHPASRVPREPTLPSDDFPLISCASWSAPLPGCRFSLSPQVLLIRLSKITKELQENLVSNVKVHNLTSSHRYVLLYARRYMHGLCHDFWLVAKISGNKLDTLNPSLFFFMLMLANTNIA